VAFALIKGMKEPESVPKAPRRNKIVIGNEIFSCNETFPYASTLQYRQDQPSSVRCLGGGTVSQPILREAAERGRLRFSEIVAHDMH